MRRHQVLERRGSTPAEAPAQPDIEIVVAPDSETALDPPYRVLIHNDDITPMDFVVLVLRAVFHLSSREAQAVMLEAHFGGMAHVTTLGHEEAKYRVGRAHGMARTAGYPLTFTIEPDGGQ